MSPAAIALTITLIIIAVGVTVGLLAGLRQKMDLEQWTVGGRGFGPLLIYLLMAGEIYTTFSFLGAGGWAYSRGGPTLYILAYLTLGNVVGFFILPHIWEMGRKHGLQTQSDFFNFRYGSKYLAAFVTAIGIIFIIPYLQLQLTGLGIIVSATSFDSISQGTAVVISVVLLTAFVFVGGIRAVAWVAILKDFLILIAALSLGVGIPYIHYGGIGSMFSALAAAHPQHLTMPGGTSNLGHTWYITTVLLTSLGFSMWPHAFASTFTAKSADTLRRNAVILPMYGAFLAFIFFVGYTALLVVPGLTNGDLSVLTIVQRSLPAWFLGFIGGAGALTAMVPASVMLLTTATLFSKNLFRPIFAPQITDNQVARLARAVVVVLSLISLYFALHSSATLVSLLLLGYAGVSQFFPGVVLGLFWRRATIGAVFSGLLCGEATVAFLMLTNRDPFYGWSAGFIALCLNFLAVVSLSLVAAPSRKNAEIPVA